MVNVGDAQTVYLRGESQARPVHSVTVDRSVDRSASFPDRATAYSRLSLDAPSNKPAIIDVFQESSVCVVSDCKSGRHVVPPCVAALFCQVLLVDLVVCRLW